MILRTVLNGSELDSKAIASKRNEANFIVEFKHIECMGCQITKEEDEKPNDQQTNTTDATMTNRNTVAAEFKSRLEWKLCVVSVMVDFLSMIH